MAYDYSSIALEKANAPGWVEKIINALKFIKDKVVQFFLFIGRKLRELLPKKKDIIKKESEAVKKQRDILSHMDDNTSGDAPRKPRDKSPEEKRQEEMLEAHKQTQERFMTAFVDMIMQVQSYMSNLPYLVSRVQEYLNHREKKSLIEVIESTIKMADDIYVNTLEKVNAAISIYEVYHEKYPDGPTLITPDGCDMLQECCDKLGKDIAKNLGNAISSLQNASIAETDETEAKMLVKIMGALQSYANHDTTLANQLIRLL